jgi:hypothetical protein
VEHFQCGAEIVDAFRQRARDHAPGFAAQNRTKALAAGENAVAHRLVNGNGVLGFGGNQTLQCLIGRDPALFQSVSEHGT